MDNFDSTYEEGYNLAVVKEVDEIRSEALQQVQKMYPEIQYVIDNRTIDDYSQKIWDYPGKWYLYFKLPAGFHNKEELIRSIAQDTISFFTEKKQ